jgi:uncharacterized protein YeaC (DUF1315 family)
MIWPQLIYFIFFQSHHSFNLQVIILYELNHYNVNNTTHVKYHKQVTTTTKEEKKTWDDISAICISRLSLIRFSPSSRKNSSIEER